MNERTGPSQPAEEPSIGAFQQIEDALAAEARTNYDTDRGLAQILSRAAETLPATSLTGRRHGPQPASGATKGKRGRRDEFSVVALVERAVNGDQTAWNDMVERYAPLMESICVRYRLGDQDIGDVMQTVWLLLVEHLGKLREPAALPAWLVMTTHRECRRALTAARKTENAGTKLDDALLIVDSTMIEQEILAHERNAALRLALRGLPPRCQQLLTMLTSDPPRSYAEISAALQIPIGSIGPQRARCLERLRRTAALAGSVPERHDSTVQGANNVPDDWDDERLLAALRD